MKKVLLVPAYVATKDDWCHTIPAGEVVEVIEQYSADSLVSHPDCKGFPFWNEHLGDVEQ